MIFVVESEEMSLYAFETEAEAVAACEGLDVEDEVWLFYASDGSPLKPVFTVANNRGSLLAVNGEYHLVASNEERHEHLRSVIDDVLNFDSSPPLNSSEGVKAYLASRGCV